MRWSGALRADRAGASPSGRALWPMVLVLACAMVVTDFVRHPFTGTPPGSAATAARDLTLWTAGTDVGATPGKLARAAARQLDVPDARVSVRSVDGGVSAAVLGLLDDKTGAGDDLLVVHAGTFADLERERHEVGLADVPEQAARAERLLLAARPVAMLADDTLLVAATRRSGMRTAGELVGRLRSDADGIVLGVNADPWARNALAALVDSADTHGRVRYRVLPSDHQAGFLDRGGADAVVAPASELRRHALAARLVPLAQSDGGPRLDADGRPLGSASAAGPGETALPTLGGLLGSAATAAPLHRWIAVVAPPALRGERRVRVATRLRRLTQSHAWRRALARLGLGAPARQISGDLLRQAFVETRALVAVATRIDRRSDTSAG